MCISLWAHARTPRKTIECNINFLGDGLFPSVIDIYGTNGGLMEARPAMLASKGILTLALAYFKYDDLPKVPDPLDLSYFEEATEFILKQPNVSSHLIEPMEIKVVLILCESV